MSKMKLVALGDSIIRGVILKTQNDDMRYTLSDLNIVDRCGRQLQCDVVNLGKMGCTVPKGESILERSVDRIYGAKYVLLEYGGNDSDYDWAAIAQSPNESHLPKTPLEEYESSYVRVIQKVRQMGCVPLVLSLPPMDAERYFRFFTQKMTATMRDNILSWLNGSTNTIMSGHELYNMATWKVAQRTHSQWIDITSGLIAGHQSHCYLCEDGIHPNELGQEYIANTILNEIM